MPLLHTNHSKTARDLALPPMPPPSNGDSMKKTLDVSAARSVAFDILRSVLARGKSFDDAMAIHDGFRRLPTRDKGFARLIAATTLRRLGQIDVMIDNCLEKPLPKAGEAVRDILRMATAEMLFLGVAPHASVDSAVTLVETRQLHKFKGLSNAVLRRLSREGKTMLEQIPETRNVPEWMLAGWAEGFGAEVAERIAAASLREPTLDISAKSNPEEWAKQLGATVLPTGSLRRAFDGPITAMPGFTEGAWWVQDAAAAIPAQLLGDIDGKRVLELCAAPGGKTAQLIVAGAKVTAIDRSEPRLGRLQRNLVRLDLEAETFVADATTWRPSEPFDAVLLDPPCTSTGTIRRHPDILHSKVSGDLAKLSALQDRLLTSAIEMVKPGGRIVFCTCSLQPEEGERRIASFLATGAPVKRDPVRPEEIGGLTEAITDAGEVRTLPFHLGDRGGLDGFFAVRLIRE
jgi:16S rRNA (cytosine967-C5)-methyltransferase